MPLVTDNHWKRRILSIKANNLEWGAGRISRQMLAESEQTGRTGVPHERTVGRILNKEWDGLIDEERTQYRVFHWPKSMEEGELPWEAGAAALELLAHWKQKGEGRFSNRLAKWFWRVTLAAPRAELDKRVEAAKLLSTQEIDVAQPVDDLSGIEGYFAFTPWRSEEDSRRYHEAVGGGDIPPFPKPSWGFSADADEETKLKEMEDMFGHDAVGDIRLVQQQKQDEQEIING